ncbi:MAG: SDR family oxidoreductase [Thermoflexibacter sp.]|jgi:short-subunit dehydrogenase|nr:SDR family oxidoreductase [Thermoflexibacter sp.]
MVVVTGGTKGIGKAIIEKFASQGMNVATCSRTKSHLVTLNSEIETKYNVNLYYLEVDMSERRDIEMFINYLRSFDEPIDAIINNTGFYISGQLHTEDEGIMEEMMRTNVYSAYHLTRGLVEGMIARQQGHIFNICSVASIKIFPNGGSYSVSKFALYGMTKLFREELKEYGIKVTAVLPGATLTSSWDENQIEPDRLVKPQDVAEAVFAAYAMSASSVVEEIIIRPQLGDL